MKHFFKKIGRFLIIGAVVIITSLGSSYAVGDIFYVSGMYRKSLNPKQYSPYWERIKTENETVTKGLFRGHEVTLKVTCDGQTSVSSSESMISLISDFIQNRDLTKYNLSEDEKAYLAISFYYVLKS